MQPPHPPVRTSAEILEIRDRVARRLGLILAKAWIKQHQAARPPLAPAPSELAEKAD